jgi:Tfp pilus assembly protein PilO
MRGMTARERLMIVLVGVAAIVAVFYLFVYTPMSARIDVLRRDLVKQQTELRGLQALAATKALKEQEFATLSERIKLIEVRLPPEREIPTLIRQLQDTAGEIGIRLNLLRPGATQAGAAPAAAGQPRPQQPQQAAPAGQAPPYQQFRLDLAFEGTYADLMAFLGRLENFPRFLVLKQVAIAPAELPKLRVTMAADTFVLPRDKVPQPKP